MINNTHAIVKKYITKYNLYHFIFIFLFSMSVSEQINLGIPYQNMPELPFILLFVFACLIWC